jgi:hypothetical protein
MTEYQFTSNDKSLGSDVQLIPRADCSNYGIEECSDDTIAVLTVNDGNYITLELSLDHVNTLIAWLQEIRDKAIATK